MLEVEDQEEEMDTPGRRFRNRIRWRWSRMQVVN
jgi:hypothetical protein